MKGRLANAIYTVSILCVVVAGCGRGRSVVPVCCPWGQLDAGARPDGGQDASVTGRGGSDDPSARDAGTPSDTLDSSTPTSDPTQVGRGCDLRSNGAVHALVPSGTEIGEFLTELSFDGQLHDKCGAFRMGKEHAYTPTLRRSDGAVFYLRNGYIYRYIADELTQAGDAAVVVADGKSPFDNDIKLEISGHSCPASKDAGVGPFGRYMFTPNGRLVYSCAADPNFTFYNEKHEALGESGWVAAVDNDDNLLLRTRGVINSEIFDNILDHGVRKSLKVVGDMDYCLSDWQFRAVRALSRGFMMVLNNHCGLQLWQSTDTELKLVSYYIHAPQAGADLRAITQHSELAPDNTFYFAKVLCPYDGLCVRCQGSYCALKPNFKEPSPMPYEVYKSPDALKDWDHGFLQTWWNN